MHCTRKLLLAANDISEEIINDVIEDIYPCKLVVTYHYNQEEESTITDFSLYKKKGIIGITLNKTIENEDCEEQKFYYQQAVVYQVRGHWLWKVL